MQGGNKKGYRVLVSVVCSRGESGSVFVSQWDVDLQGVWLLNLQVDESHCLVRTSENWGGGDYCDIGDCDVRAKQNTSQKTIPTAEDTYITENINPYFSVLHEMTVMWHPLA